MDRSATVFATLTPLNTLAKRSFDDVVCERQSNTPGVGRHLYVKPHRDYDKDVLLARRIDQLRRQSDNYDSDSPTDIDTDTEQDLKSLGVIWSGWFTFDLGCLPAKPHLGWVAGKGRNGIQIDFPLAKTQYPAVGVKGYHARFNFHQNTGFIYISKGSRAPDAEVVVNGQTVGPGEQFVFNRSPMNLRCGLLEYRFEYTDFARTKEFGESRTEYMTDTLEFVGTLDFTLTPTPASTSRSFGNWSMAIPLGKGSFGKVFSATNSKGEVVAMKILERNQKTVQQVDDEIQVLRVLQTLSEPNDGDRDRVIRLKEVVYQSGTDLHTSAPFDDIALVLEPAVRGTLADVIDPQSEHDIVDTFKLFHDSILGLNFLHSHGWVHGDIKPSNIGLTNMTPRRAVLFDMGGAVHLELGHMLLATPGRGGTVNYLAPEREMHEHDASIDIWALGVVGFEIVHGYHPWKLARNPWRPGTRFEALRPDFDRMYNDAVARMRNDDSLSLNALFLQMLRHPWAKENHGPRITTQDALKFFAESDGPLAKRLKCR